LLDSELRVGMLVLVDKDESLQPAEIIGPNAITYAGPSAKNNRLETPCWIVSVRLFKHCQ
jgi:hypothetical protein